MSRCVTLLHSWIYTCVLENKVYPTVYYDFFGRLLVITELERKLQRYIANNYLYFYRDWWKEIVAKRVMLPFDSPVQPTISVLFERKIRSKTYPVVMVGKEIQEKQRCKEEISLSPHERCKKNVEIRNKRKIQTKWLNYFSSITHDKILLF